MLDMHPSTMTSWITKKQKPILPQFLYFCRKIGVMPVELFERDFMTRKLNLEVMPYPQKLHAIRARLKRTDDEKYIIGQQLEKIAANQKDWRPLTDICVELGVTRKYLLYWFKDFCTQISLNHKLKIHEITTSKHAEQKRTVRNLTWYLYSQGQYPSNRKVASLIKPLKLNLARKHLRQAHRQTLNSAPILHNAIA